MKPRYRSKGTYADGRKKIIVEYVAENNLFKTESLVKPEKYLQFMNTKFIIKKPKKNKIIGNLIGNNSIHGWTLIRAKIMSRDFFKCTRCSKEENLAVHHKNKDRNDNSHENLITLCKSCHLMQHKKRRSKNQQILTKKVDVNESN